MKCALQKFSVPLSLVALSITTLTYSYTVHKINSIANRHQFPFIKQKIPTALYSNEKCTTEAALTNKNKLIPITLLAGFLGSGKTTTLKHLLENKENIKIGVIVNDVASVNIDSKLITSTSTTSNDNEVMSESNSIQLENGCACCSISDELLVSIERLINLKQREEDDAFDEIVIELSGVADPASVLLNFKQAQMQKHPVTLLSNITNVVTLIDSTTFGSDFMTQHLVRNRDNWMPDEEDCVGNRQISELLVEQVECANTILLNKIDLASEDQVATASNVATGLNENAILKTIEYGRVSASDFFNKIDDICEDPDSADTSHSHSHEHSDVESDATVSQTHSHSHSHEESCSDPTCTDSSHDHSHDHNASCNDPTCTDASHDHSHSHNHDSCNDPTCTDSSHSHSHSHDHDSSCSDPTCTDPTHDHSHDHNKNTATSNLGISNFVYKSAKPFNPIRIMSLLYTWPILHNQNDLDLTLFTDPDKIATAIPEEIKENPFLGVLRSKGFAWIAPSSFFDNRVVINDVWRHNTAMYWSHAGKHFGLNTAGQWWGSIQMDQMKELFKENMAEYERIVREDFYSDEFGDRRQELVFIGVNMNEDGIRKRLQECECTDDEMAIYREKVKEFEMSLMTQEDNVQVVL